MYGIREYYIYIEKIRPISYWSMNSWRGVIVGGVGSGFGVQDLRFVG